MLALDLKGKQVQCLFALYNLPDGASLTELCTLCDADKGAMSRTIKELTTKGLVYIDEQATQKYRNPLKLTTQGQAAAKIVYDKVGSILNSVSADITPPEREIMYKTLTQIADNLNQICENYGEKND